MEKSHSILKFYLSTTDKINGRLLYEHIVQQAQKQGISGVTVYRGIMGYGLSSTIYTSKFWELTEKLPVMVEMIDETEKLEVFFRALESELLELPKGCLVTLDPVTVKLHKPGKH
jgi:PII-like signaling protein